jgi:hypothetical protein
MSRLYALAASRLEFLLTPRETASQGDATRNTPMLDVLMVAFGLGLFLLAVGYAHGLDRFT